MFVYILRHIFQSDHSLALKKIRCTMEFTVMWIFDKWNAFEISFFALYAGVDRYLFPQHKTNTKNYYNHSKIVIFHFTSQK